MSGRCSGRQPLTESDVYKQVINPYDGSVHTSYTDAVGLTLAQHSCSLDPGTLYS